MAKLKHEIWIEDGPNGPLPSLVLAGPDGDLFRHGLAPTARLVKTFEAESNYEAMTAYYAHLGWGEYKLNLPEDKRPYPDLWLKRQQDGMRPPETLQDVMERASGPDTADADSTSGTQQLGTARRSGA